MKTITDIHGVYANGIAAGIKPGKKDLAYIYVPNAVGAAGVFTTNKFRAACVTYTQKMMKRHTVKAVIINSGNANAATGELGVRNAKRTAQKAATLFKIPATEVVVASTGIIGVQLPIDLVEAGLDQLLRTPATRDGMATASAIMTTDLVPKHAYAEAKIGKKIFQVAGIAKGSGMIAPNMATMLGFIVTNATIESPLLAKWLKEAVDESFNRISVDGDTSTNDMVLAFATGEHSFSVTDPVSNTAFKALLLTVCQDLAKAIARDGEGATKLIEVVVENAANRVDAEAIGRSVINSPLVKTALHGADPNWGRVVAAVGKTENVKLNPDKVSVWFGDHAVFKDGVPLTFDRAAVVGQLKESTVSIRISMGLGAGRSKSWGCDLTKGYIDINTEYS
jgi:glutamate N-acetyltransferase/amino-acid N-acetyltransferase